MGLFTLLTDERITISYSVSWRNPPPERYPRLSGRGILPMNKEDSFSGRSNNGGTTLAAKKGVKTKHPRGRTATSALIARPLGKDTDESYRRKLEVARQHCVEMVGAAPLEAMVRTIHSDGPDKLLRWTDILGILGRDFGLVYGADLRRLATSVLEAHKAYLIDAGKFKMERPKSTQKKPRSTRTARRKPSRKWKS